jgi:hypothetical protein
MATIKNKNIQNIFRNERLLFDSQQIVIRSFVFGDSERGDCVHDIIVERNIIFKPDIILQTATIKPRLYSNRYTFLLYNRVIMSWLLLVVEPQMPTYGTCAAADVMVSLSSLF